MHAVIDDRIVDADGCKSQHYGYIADGIADLRKTINVTGGILIKIATDNLHAGAGDHRAECRLQRQAR